MPLIASRTALFLIGTAACFSSAAAQPAGRVGYDWHLRIDESDRAAQAILAYEKNDTDDQELSFTCEAGGARIFAGISGGPAGLSGITLTSGTETLRLSGKTVQTEIPELPSFTSAEIAGGHPFMSAFAANGGLRAIIGSARIEMVGTKAGAKAVADFVAHCEGR